MWSFGLSLLALSVILSVVLLAVVISAGVEKLGIIATRMEWMQKSLAEAVAKLGDIEWEVGRIADKLDLGECDDSECPCHFGDTDIDPEDVYDDDALDAIDDELTDSDGGFDLPDFDQHRRGK